MNFPKLKSAGVRGAREVALAQLRHTSDCPWYIGRGGACSCERVHNKPSAVVAAFDRRIALEHANPLLALAYLVEATADGRTGGDVYDYSKLQTLGAEARRMLRQLGLVEKRLDLYPAGRT